MVGVKGFQFDLVSSLSMKNNGKHLCFIFSNLTNLPNLQHNVCNLINWLTSANQLKLSSRFLFLSLVTCAAAAPQWFPGHPVAPYSPYGFMPYTALQHTELPAEGRFLTTSTVSSSIP